MQVFVASVVLYLHWNDVLSCSSNLSLWLKLWCLIHCGLKVIYCLFIVYMKQNRQRLLTNIVALRQNLIIMRTIGVWVSLTLIIGIALFITICSYCSSPTRSSIFDLMIFLLSVDLSQTCGCFPCCVGLLICPLLCLCPCLSSILMGQPLVRFVLSAQTSYYYVYVHY